MLIPLPLKAIKSGYRGMSQVVGVPQEGFVLRQTLALSSSGRGHLTSVRIFFVAALLV